MSDLKITGLYKRYGNIEVLKDINLDIRSGEFIVFVGPSGCGKSTLLRTISGLETISAGQLEIGGRVVNDVAPSKRGIAMVFQSYALYPHMTVFDNMAYSLKLTRTPRAEIEKKVRAAADMLQLSPYLDRLPKALSGGQRQRVAIGRAIVRNPQVFLFDEPLSNLDAALRVATRMEIAKLKESLPDTTMIYVTHDQVEAMTLADRIVVLKDGVVMQVGTPMELYDHPQSLFVAGFIGSPQMNFLTGPNAAPYKAATVGVRPEHMEVLPDGKGAWSGKVIYSEDLGSDSYIYADIGQDEAVIVRQDGKTPYHSGDTISFSPKGDLYHRFDEAGKPMGSGGVAAPVDPVQPDRELL
ncbi:ABC transporter ATP-binding protein [Pelagibacterium lacus]|uniref:ABC transporter ATP-binding protein n=1 Tax=Pelagibacterium lacus TaxID=2282655 RepID=A0A369W028_9HYPH|nr:ABC transporter ATP-binding protein [Pelagibacterium lacus]RDE07996.1 ABC transporter ATP-binding protein [Pelagibacterium lacus]